MTISIVKRLKTTSATMRGTAFFKLDLNYIERLRTLAKSRRRTPHFLMKEAIQQYLLRAENDIGYRSRTTTEDCIPDRISELVQPLR